MPNAMKLEIIRAYFDDFRRKTEQLGTWDQAGFRDESMTLCIVYIDRLGSGYYGGGQGRNRRNFNRVLEELGGNQVFAMLHPRELSDLIASKLPAALSIVASVLSSKPRDLAERAHVEAAIRSSSLLSQADKDRICLELWRASMANIVYEYMRTGAVHGAGSISFSFDETIFEGEQGLRIDFAVLHQALLAILDKVEQVSIETGYWFGNANLTSSAAGT